MEFAAVVTSGSFAPRNVGVARSACSSSASSWRAGLPKMQGGLPVFGGKLPARTFGCFFVGTCSGPAWRARIRGLLLVFLIEAPEQVPPGGTDLGPAKPYPKSHQGTSAHWHLRPCLLAVMQLSVCMQHYRKVRCKNQSGRTEFKVEHSSPPGLVFELSSKRSAGFFAKILASTFRPSDLE